MRNAKGANTRMEKEGYENMTRSCSLRWKDAFCFGLKVRTMKKDVGKELLFLVTRCLAIMVSGRGKVLHLPLGLNIAR